MRRRARRADVVPQARDARGSEGGALRRAREPHEQSAASVFVPGTNCWRVERATRFRCVQDGSEYFRLVREAILAARHSIFILGWDIAASVDLLPGATGAQEPTKLAALLDFVARRRPGLRVYVLIWDYAALYALERDPSSRLRFGWGTHRHVRFRFDDQHPLGASHHQKIVVIDDALAFSGGLDLTGHRWDTTAHEHEHTLRRNVMGQHYTPFHDVQALVEGPVAASLGELARERWRRRGRTRLPPRAPEIESAWPAGLEPDFENVDVAIARTEPRFRAFAPVRECERLFLDSIAAARRSIYVENQYFTNADLGEALARRLREPDGPEVVILGPKNCSGWLEQKTMGALRHEVLTNLVKSDHHGRLRLLHPIASREHDVCTFIHSKVMVIDDELLRIGSANLSNRSMGMDTECDLALEARGDERVRASIARVRARLIAEHVEGDLEDVLRAHAQHGSLRAALDALSGGDHTLAEVCVDVDAVLEPWDGVRAAADPKEPASVTRAFDRFLPEIAADDERTGLVARVLPLAALTALALVATRMVDWDRWRQLGEVQDLFQRAPHMDGIPLAAAFVFVVGALFFVPLELLVLTAFVVFGVAHGAWIACLGALCASLAGYTFGRALGHQRVVRLIGMRAYRLWRELRGRGATAVAVLRLASVASATTGHLLCGAARIPLRAYVAGTAIGLLPGLVALGLLGGLLRRVILHPGPWTALATILAALVFIAIVLRLRNELLRMQLRTAEGHQAEASRFG